MGLTLAARAALLARLGRREPPTPNTTAGRDFATLPAALEMALKDPSSRPRRRHTGHELMVRSSTGPARA